MNHPPFGLPLLLAAVVSALPAAGAPSARVLPPVPGTAAAAALPPPADPDHFVFAVGGDNRAAGRGVPMPPTAARIFAELRLLQPAFILWTGDAIYGDDDTVGEARAEYAAFRAAAAVADAPLFNAPGNHEIFDRRDLEAIYEENIGPLYGSFDYGHSHFIALDTEELGRPPGIGAAQREWLQADLEAHRTAANIVVFTHHPLFPAKASAGWADPANRDDIHRLFVTYGVKVVFSGHEHLFHESVHDGIRYVVTGGAGAPIDEAPERGGFEHYLLVTVNGGDLTMTVIEPWRLFVDVGPVRSDGSCTAQVVNYNPVALAVAVEFPTDALGPRTVAKASTTYKGHTEPLAAEIIPPRHPGTTRVTLTVPHSRAAEVVIGPGGP